MVLNYQILNALGGLIITGPVAILAYLWVLLKSKPTADEKPPSTGLYIGVWFLSSFISGNIAQLIAFFLGYNFSSVFLERNPDVGAIIAIWGIVISSSFLITFTCYKRFPRLNFKKVIPYFWVLGVIGILLAIGQVTQTHKEQFYNKNDFNTVLLSVFAIGIGCLFILTSQLSKAENEKNTKAKLDPSLKSTQAKSKSYNNPEPTPVVGTKNEIKTLDQAEMLEPTNNVHKKSKPEIDLEKYPTAATVIEYDKQASTLWEELQIYSENAHSSFLNELEKDPKIDLKKLFGDITEADNLARNPYEDPAANKSFNEAMNISDEAKLEFQRVYELLGSKITPDELLTKIRDKFAPATKLNLHKGWEDVLMQAEWSGDVSSMLKALKLLGYSVNEEEKFIIRPIRGESPSLEIHYADANDLMTKVAFERKILGRASE